MLARARALPSVRDRAVRNAVAAVNELSRMAPTDAAVAPPPVPLRRADADGPIEVLAILRGCIADTEALRWWSLGPPRPDGSQPVRNPQYFARATELKIELVEAMVKLSERALDLQRMKALFDAVMSALGDAAPQVRDRVAKRLHGIDALRGFSDYSPPNGENDAT